MKTKPQDLGRAVKPETAAAVGSMMRAAVEHGTGTRRADPGRAGVRQDGHGRDRALAAWLRPGSSASPVAARNQVAVAVVLEQQPSGSTGGHTAAPVAKQVLQALIGGAANS